MAVPSGVDPHEVLGVTPSATAADLTAAYRSLAKRWHPDHARSAGAADRMALINAAYAELRGREADHAPHGRWSTAAPDVGGSTSRRGGSPGVGDAPPVWPPRDPTSPFDGPQPLRTRRHPRPDDATPPPTWSPGFDGRLHVPQDEDGPALAPRDDGLEPAVLRALGAELRSALQPGEEVGIVVPATTWASPQTTLAVTDRRVLWLLDDAPVHRVRAMTLSEISAVHVRPPRPWRRMAQVVCTDRRGRHTTFGEMPPETAAAVARRISGDPKRTSRRAPG